MKILSGYVGTKKQRFEDELKNGGIPWVICIEKKYS